VAWSSTHVNKNAHSVKRMGFINKMSITAREDKIYICEIYGVN